MSRLNRSHYPKYPKPYPSRETILHILEVCGWQYSEGDSIGWVGAHVVTPDGLMYVLQTSETKPALHQAWETFLDVQPVMKEHDEISRMVTQQP